MKKTLNTGRRVNPGTRKCGAAARSMVAGLLAAALLLAWTPAQAAAPGGEIGESGIIWLQQELATLDYDVTVNGVLDAQTLAAIDSFEQDYDVNDSSGLLTWDVLISRVDTEALLWSAGWITDISESNSVMFAAEATAEQARRDTQSLTGEYRGLTAAELVVAYAKEMIGVPYKWGKADPDVGFDCSGLVWYVYNELGIDVPRGTKGMNKVGQAVDSLADAKPGDILCFGRNVRHVGIYVGNNQMIHAPHRGMRVVVVDLNGRTPTYIRRVFN